MRFIDEKTRTYISNDTCNYTRGIVYIDNNYIEFGWFKESTDNIVIYIEDTYTDNYEAGTYKGISREALPNLVWSNYTGYYIMPNNMSRERLLRHKLCKGNGNFPYSFPKRYEAVDSFHIFKGAQKVLNNEDYPLSKYLNYSFGLEFETSMGYIPQEICFRDGLIPLRDGSISGLEYSTVVLQGNTGLNLLKQQLDTLKEYTKFNKECALHIHMGGFPVNPVSIFALYCLWYYVERELEGDNYIPSLSFKTSEYKNNRKDYCKKLPGMMDNFNDLFSYMTGRQYFGNLAQPHPNDVEKRAKWNIPTRYFGLNLINMLCYSGPKTVEFRFLRPTYNFRKITLWLYILNAVLIKAERLANEWIAEGNCGTDNMNEYIKRSYSGVISILNEIYDESIYKSLLYEITLLKISVRAQMNNGDYCGSDIEFEEELFV